MDAMTVTSATCRTPITAAALADEEAGAIAELFGALADPARVKILHRLASVAPEGVCVCDLMEPLALTQPAVSYHVKLLRQAGLIARERRGKFNYYSLREEAFGRIAALVGQPSSARSMPIAANSAAR
jgi:ArsR family transcriptional regulator